MISPASMVARLPRLWRESDDRLSLGMLVAINFIPLGGVIFAGWDVRFILLVYWAENLVIGFYNVLMMALAQGGAGRWDPMCLGFIPYCTVHYGIFCLGHGVFVIVMTSWSDGLTRGNPLEELGGQFRSLVLPVLALAFSHGCSFVQNYWLKGEYRTRTVVGQMLAPYARIVVLHVVVLIGGIITMLLNSALPMLVLLIVLKICLDLILHAISHRKT